MSDPVHVVIRGGVVVDSVLMDPDTAEEFRGRGFADELWPGGELADVAGVDPRPGIGWARKGGAFTPPAADPAAPPTAAAAAPPAARPATPTDPAPAG